MANIQTEQKAQRVLHALSRKAFLFSIAKYSPQYFISNITYLQS